MTWLEDVAKLLQFNLILNLIQLGYIWYLPKIIKGTVKGQGSLTYYPYPHPQVPLPITLTPAIAYHPLPLPNHIRLVQHFLHIVMYIIINTITLFKYD